MIVRRSAQGLGEAVRGFDGDGQAMKTIREAAMLSSAPVPPRLCAGSTESC
jgi:hypothetical protein